MPFTAVHETLAAQRLRRVLVGVFVEMRADDELLIGGQRDFPAQVGISLAGPFVL